jgi:hypothetical protein
MSYFNNTGNVYINPYTTTTINPYSGATTISSPYTISTSYNDNLLTLKQLSEFLEFIMTILGYPEITLEKFKNMSDSDKKQLIRDIKLNNILK